LPIALHEQGKKRIKMKKVLALKKMESVAVALLLE
jgi:hypothetical protein